MIVGHGEFRERNFQDISKHSISAQETFVARCHPDRVGTPAWIGHSAALPHAWGALTCQMRAWQVQPEQDGEGEFLQR